MENNEESIEKSDQEIFQEMYDDEYIAEENLGRYIGSYENINPELYAKYGEDAYELIDAISASIYDIAKMDEGARATIIDRNATAISEKIPAFTAMQVKELMWHFVSYYDDLMK